MEFATETSLQDIPPLRSGAILSVVEKDNEYIVTQLPNDVTLPKPVPQSRREISFTFGPVKFVGYVVTETWEIGVEIYVVGIKIGNFFGNVKQGLVIKVNLFVAKGEVRFYLKNGKEVWVHIDLKLTFDGSFSTDVKLLTI
ncbi:hypothetical protein V2W45_1329635 [Cenococcum geophilum]